MSEVIDGVEVMKRTPEPLVVSVGLGAPTRLGDSRVGGGVRFEPELQEVTSPTVLELTSCRAKSQV